jgi:hypothetical protein
MQEPDRGTGIMEGNRTDIIKTLNPTGTQPEQLQVDINKVKFCQQPSDITFLLTNLLKCHDVMTRV